jgi:hypothetical protein
MANARQKKSPGVAGECASCQVETWLDMSDPIAKVREVGYPKSCKQRHTLLTFLITCFKEGVANM